MKILETDHTVKKIDYRVKFSELKKNQKVGITQIVQYMGDCNLAQVEESGTGLAYQEENHVACLVSAWQVEVIRYPEFNEIIHVNTWDYKIDNCLILRNALITDDDGETIAKANCPCVFMDMAKNRPEKFSNLNLEPYNFSEALDMDYSSRKITVPKDYKALDPFEVRASEIDAYGHVNNANYIAYAEDYFPEGHIVEKMRVEYKRPAMLHDIIYPRLTILDDNTYNIQLCDAHGKPYSVMEFVFTAE